MRSPGREAAVAHEPAGHGDAGRVEDDAVDLAAAHHLGVAGDDRACASRQVAGHRGLDPLEVRCAGIPPRGSRRRSAPRTSVAPIMARSLTVPQTASRPMSPPGKKIGMDDVRVGGDHEPAVADPERGAVVHRPAGPRRAATCPGRRGAKTSSISARIARPPAPCLSVMRSSRKQRAGFLTTPSGSGGRRTGARSCRCPR